MSSNVLSRRAVLSGALVLISRPSRADPATARTADVLLAAARRQIGVTLTYDPSYAGIAFPNGDVDRTRGVCTDVIIRAYRDAFGLDLQQYVNADMRAAFSAYPRRWGAKQTDTNIDHRRVPNLEVFFTRAGAKRDVPSDLSSWQPGDIVTSRIDNRLPHIGLVSDRSRDGRPLVIHNIGSGAREEDALLDHPIVARFRWALALS